MTEISEWKKAAYSLFPSEGRTPEAKKIAELIRTAPPPKHPKIFNSECDEDAYEVIAFSDVLSKDQFLGLPALDSVIVYHIIQRMNTIDKYNSLLLLKLARLRPSLTKQRQSEEQWEPYITEFHRLLEETKNPAITNLVAWARKEIGDRIEAENRERIERGDELVCVKKSKDGITKPRPNRGTLTRQLVLNQE